MNKKSTFWLARSLLNLFPFDKIGVNLHYLDQFNIDLNKFLINTLLVADSKAPILDVKDRIRGFEHLTVNLNQ